MAAGPGGGGVSDDEDEYTSDHDADLLSPMSIAGASSSAQTPARKAASRLTFAFHFLNNVGAGFNLTVMGLVLENLAQAIEESSEEKSMVAGAGFLGALSGQIIMGFLGDIMGRAAALVLTTMLIIGGAITSSALELNGSFFVSLAMARFFTCVGVGGVYPLTATSSSEENSRVSPTLLVFSGQGFGQLLVPLLVLSLRDNSSSIWRSTLAMGAFPSVLGLSLFALHSFQQQRQQQRGRSEGEEKVQTTQSSFLAAFCHKGTMRKLVGTGMTWFIFDVTFYSNVVFAQEVLGRMLNNTDTQKSAAAAAAGPNSIVLLIGLFGYAFSYAFIDSLGLRRLQMFGFAVLTALYGMLAITIETLHPLLLFALYSATFFFSNFGPNATTFCLPSKTFPVQVRSTFNGVSAGLGKLGAFVGIVLFPLVKRDYGIEAVLALSSLVALSGLLVTYFLVFPNDKDAAGGPGSGGVNGGVKYKRAEEHPRAVAVTPSSAAAGLNHQEDMHRASGNPFLTMLEKV